LGNGLKRREFLKLAGTAAASRIFPGYRGFQSKEKQKRLNFLLIFVDDLRPETGCYGSDFVKTPNIDRLAHEGLVFSRAYCQMAICNPSRASMMTGMRPDTIRVFNNVTHFRKINPWTLTLPQFLIKNGYVSIAVGKIFHNTLPDSPSWTEDRPVLPVDHIYASKETQIRQRSRKADAIKLGRSESWILARIRGPATEAFDAPDYTYWDGAVASKAIANLWKLQRYQPFFLAVGFIRPHLPFVAPKKYWDLYSREDIPLAPNNFPPKNAPRLAMNSLTELASYEDFVGSPKLYEGHLSETQARLLKHGYYASVSFTDAQVGRVLEALDHMGLRENTIVILVSDNSFKLGEHGSWCKFTNYEIDTRVPLIISAPGRIPQNASTKALVELVDLYPTVCEMAGLETPSGREGTSLVPLFSDSSFPWKTAAFSQFPRGYFNRFMGYAMRTDRYRYVEWHDRLDNSVLTNELYDHETDPLENENIAGCPENLDLVKQLARKLDKGWRAARPIGWQGMEVGKNYTAYDAKQNR
jgi:iduronate 2-sulfatase